MYVLAEMALTACDVGEGGLDAELTVQLCPRLMAGWLVRLALTSQVLHTASNMRRALVISLRLPL